MLVRCPAFNGRMSWVGFTSLCGQRQTGPKDGDSVIPATFAPDADEGIRRLKQTPFWIYACGSRCLRPFPRRSELLQWRSLSVEVPP